MTVDITDRDNQHLPEEDDDNPFTIEGPPPDAEEITRRQFMNRATIALSGLVGLTLASPLAAFLIAPLFNKPPEIWRTVGAVGDFTTGATTKVSFLEASPLEWAGVTALTAAWMRKNSETEFVCYSVSCSHLGCPVQWESGARLFMCPCHGGVYYEDGEVAAGPPPQALSRYQVRVENGYVQVNVSVRPTPPSDSPERRQQNTVPDGS